LREGGKAGEWKTSERDEREAQDPESGSDFARKENSQIATELRKEADVTGVESRGNR
jgi:hypothetical protein